MTSSKTAVAPTEDQQALLLLAIKELLPVFSDYE